MRNGVPWLRTIALAFGIAAIVALVGAITHTFTVAVGIVTFGVVLLVAVSIEATRRYWRTQSAGVAVEVRRADGRRETVTLDPTDEESMTRFSRALEDDFARPAPPETAAVSPTHEQTKGIEDVGNRNP